MFIALQTPETPAPASPSAGPPPFPLWLVAASPDWQAEVPASDFRLSRVDSHHQSTQEQTLTPLAWAALPHERIKRAIMSPHRWLYTGNWGGVTLKTLFAQLPASEGTPKYLTQRNALGHTQTLRLTDELLANALVADSLNGQPIPPEWGGPRWLILFDRAHTLGLEQLTELWWCDDAPRLPNRLDSLQGDDVQQHGQLEAGQYLDCNSGQWVNWKPILPPY